MNKTLSIISKVALLYFLFVLFSQFYIGLNSLPTEGDSINYHIPFAHAYLNGTIIDPEKIKDAVPFLKYMPGSAEAILAPFVLLNIPLNVYNVLAIAILALSLWKLGRVFKLSNDLSILFAVSFSTLHGVMRWSNAQTIDIWLAVFFTCLLILLESPKKSLGYFLKLGVFAGLLIGTKYSGPLFGLVLFVVYIKELVKYINIKRIAVFAIPFTFIGLSWYIRNYILKQNPFYPQESMFFRGDYFPILKTPSWYIYLVYPTGLIQNINAFISEYMVWMFSLPIAIYVVLKNISKNMFRLILDDPINRLFIIGIFGFIIYLFLPSAPEFHIMMSSFRYSFPAFIALILGVFLLAKKYKKEELIGLIAVGTMFATEYPDGYFPKLVFIYLPLFLFFYYNYHKTLPKRLKRLKIKYFK